MSKASRYCPGCMDRFERSEFELLTEGAWLGERRATVHRHLACMSWIVALVTVVESGQVQASPSSGRATA